MTTFVLLKISQNLLSLKFHFIDFLSHLYLHEKSQLKMELELLLCQYIHFFQIFIYTTLYTWSDIYHVSKQKKKNCYSNLFIYLFLFRCLLSELHTLGPLFQSYSFLLNYYQRSIEGHLYTDENAYCNSRMYIFFILTEDNRTKKSMKQ